MRVIIVERKVDRGTTCTDVGACAGGVEEGASARCVLSTFFRVLDGVIVISDVCSFPDLRCLGFGFGFSSKGDGMVVECCDWCASCAWCVDDGCGGCYDWETGMSFHNHIHLHSHLHLCVRSTTTPVLVSFSTHNAFTN